MTQKVIFKKISEEDFKEVLKWKNANSNRSFFCQNNMDIINTDLLKALSQSKGAALFLYKSNETKALILFTSINRYAHYTYYSLFIENDFHKHKEHLLMFLQQYCLDENMRKIQSTIIASDQEALKQIKELGFEEEGTLAEHFFDGNKYIDIKVFGKFMG